MDKLDEVAQRFVALLEAFGVPYAMMGGFAVRLYALPRATYDVDFVATISRDDLPKLYAASEQAGFVVSETQRSGWIDSVRDFAVVKFQWYIESRSIDIDLFLVESPFQREIIRRRQRAGANGWETWFVTAEDLVLLKLLAGRNKDLADVADILLVQGPLDLQYLRTWAAKLGIAEALETAIQECPR